MPRKPTNTLIITNIDDSLLSNPEPIISLLGDQPYMIELIVLMKFKRILLYCQTSKIATKTKTFLLNQWETTTIGGGGGGGGNSISISYSLKDNKSGPQFLEIPKELEMKRFLISPPGSPHAEWDNWDKVEEGPNEQNIHDYLWDKLGKLSDDEDTDDENNNNNKVNETKIQVPTIVLDHMEE